MKYEALARWSLRLSEQRHLYAIRKGLLAILPVILAGSFAVLVNNLPVSAYQSFMTQTFGEGWKNLGGHVYNATIGTMSLTAAFAIAYFLASSDRRNKGSNGLNIITAVIALCAVCVFMYQDSGLAGIWSGVLGFFTSLLIALVAAELFLLLHRKIRLRSLRLTGDSDEMLHAPLQALLPGILTLSMFALVRLLLAALGITDIFQNLQDSMNVPFLNMRNTVGTALLINLLEHILWFFGIHGTNAFEPVIRELYNNAMALNLQAVASGEVPTEILTKPFFDVFVYLGGAGSTLCLILALMMGDRSGHTRALSRMSLVTGVFNINELVVFGLPVVLNPIYVIPFLLTPVVLTLTSWAAMRLGLVPVVVQQVSWTTPPLLSGYLATESLRGVMLQVFNLAVGVGIYLPFVRFRTHLRTLQLKDSLVMVNELALDNTVYVEASLLSRDDSAGHMARVLAYDLRGAIATDGLSLHYQPQIGRDGTPVGVEALLRWQHPRFGYIIPPVTLKLAEESNLTGQLGYWILEKAFHQQSLWNAQGLHLRMSVNLSVTQLYDAELPGRVRGLLRLYDLNPADIELEVTETMAIHEETPQIILTALRELGVRIAIDDFGMGHSSLVYIRMFSVQTLKLDGALVREVVSSTSDQEIITSICNLCKSLEIEVVAEFVETQAQRDMLARLGVDIMQGWLYAKAMPPEDCEGYIAQSAAKL